MINVSIHDLSITLRPSSVHSSIRFLSSDSKSRPSSSTTTSSSSATAQWVKNGKKCKNELLHRDKTIKLHSFNGISAAKVVQFQSLSSKNTNLAILFYGLK